MRVYFIRHGESEENAFGIHGGGASPLTEKGEEQTRFLAKRFENIPADCILSSDMVRAQKTAEEVSKGTGLGVEYLKLLRESQAPSALLGKNVINPDPETNDLLEAWHEKRFIDENFRYADEENVSDLKKRAREALSYLEARKEKDIIAVTHGTFLRVMVGVMLLGDEFTPQLLLTLREQFRMRNTGITVCEYTTRFRQDTSEYAGHFWQIVTWNDHAHLG